MVRAKRAKHNAISVNLSGLRGMVMSVYVMVVQESDHPSIEGAPVAMLGDNVSVATRVIKCVGTRGPRAAFWMEDRNASWLVQRSCSYSRGQKTY